MEQQRDPSGESSVSDAVDEEVGGADTGRLQGMLDRYYWALLGTAVVIATATSLALVYTQYGQINETVSASPYASRLVDAARRMPLVGGSADSTWSESKLGSFTELEQLVVNPAGSGSNRYLAVSLAYETNSASVTKELKKKKVVVRDAVLRLLSQRTADHLSDPSNRGDLKEALRKETNSILSSGNVDRLYFTEFVLQ